MDTLESLEKEKWGEPEYDSHLVIECHRLRKIPISQFTIENLRIMIGQGLSLEILVPLALQILVENPFSSGDGYCGDLLNAVLNTEWSYWETHQEQFDTLQEIMGLVKEQVLLAKNDLLPAWNRYFK